MGGGSEAAESAVDSVAVGSAEADSAEGLGEGLEEEEKAAGDLEEGSVVVGSVEAGLAEVDWRGFVAEGSAEAEEEEQMVASGTGTRKSDQDHRARSGCISTTVSCGSVVEASPKGLVWVMRCLVEDAVSVLVSPVVQRCLRHPYCNVLVATRVLCKLISARCLSHREGGGLGGSAHAFG